MIDLQVTLTGPLFDGRAVQAVEDWVEDSEETVADEGVNRVKQRLGQVLRNPTGAYEGRIMTDRQQDDSAVTDDQAVYGPWLEGVSSRNQTTSFKGYHTFRIVAEDLRGDAAAIAEQVLQRYLGRMQ